MIPEIKKLTKTDVKIRLGRLLLKENAFDGLDETVAILNNSLCGDAEIPVFVEKLTGDEEKYTISANDERIRIQATEKGVYDAFSTLFGLVKKDADGSYITECEVEDEARFSHRGFLLDVARHFQTVDTVKCVLDMLFKLKLNVFHWHLSDDQGFRIMLPGYEAMAENASKRAYSYVGGFKYAHSDETPHSGIYSVEEIRDVLAYAKARGIKVIPEIDLPGHFSAVLSSHPEYTCEGKPFEVPGSYGILQNTLCLGNDEAREFAKGLLLAVARVFGTDLMHVGFDEIRTDKLKNCPKCQARKKALGIKTERQLIGAFREEVRDYLLENGVKIICWNDGLDEVDNKATVQHWKPGTAKLTAKRINAGQKMIISDFMHYYCDYPYCMTPLKKTYEFDPVMKGVEKPENVVGVEAPLWAEWVEGPDKVYFYATYRMAALAETAWNEQKRPYSEFIKDLRTNDEYYFGRKLDIPDEILTPKKRVSRLFAFMGSDWNLELNEWKNKTNN